MLSAKANPTPEQCHCQQECHLCRSKGLLAEPHSLCCCCQPRGMPVLLLAGMVPHGALARGAGAEHGGSQGCANLIPRAKGKNSTRLLRAHKTPISIASCELLYMGLSCSFPCSQGPSPRWRQPQHSPKINGNPQAGSALN